MRRIIFSLITLLLLACSCQDYKKLQITDSRVEKLESLTFEKGKVSSKMNVFLKVENPTSSSFTLKSVDAVVYTKSQEKFADVTALEEAKVEPNSHIEVPILLNVVLYNPLAALSRDLFSSFNKDEVQEMTLDLDMVVSGGGFSNKKISMKGVLLKDLINQNKK